MSKFLLAALGAGALWFGTRAWRSGSHFSPRHRVLDTAKVAVCGFFWPITVPLHYISLDTELCVTKSGKLCVIAKDEHETQAAHKLLVVGTVLKAMHVVGCLSAAAAGIGLVLFCQRHPEAVSAVMPSGLSNRGELVELHRLAVVTITDGYLAGALFPLGPLLRLFGVTKPMLLVGA